LSVSRRVSRTQLNVRSGYAASDHRLLIDAIKRRLSSDSICQSQIDQDQSRSASGMSGLASTRLAPSAIAEHLCYPERSLLERR